MYISLDFIHWYKTNSQTSGFVLSNMPTKTTPPVIWKAQPANRWCTHLFILDFIEVHSLVKGQLTVILLCASIHYYSQSINVNAGSKWWFKRVNAWSCGSDACKRKHCPWHGDVHLSLSLTSFVGKRPTHWQPALCLKSLLWSIIHNQFMSMQEGNSDPRVSTVVDSFRAAQKNEKIKFEEILKRQVLNMICSLIHTLINVCYFSYWLLFAGIGPWNNAFRW